MTKQNHRRKFISKLLSCFLLFICILNTTLANTTQIIAKESSGEFIEQENQLQKEEKEKEQQQEKIQGYQTDRFIIKYKDNTSREKVKSKTKNNIQAVQTMRKITTSKNRAEKIDIVRTNS